LYFANKNSYKGCDNSPYPDYDMSNTEFSSGTFTDLLYINGNIEEKELNGYFVKL
jgi:hypothetical protein